MSFGPNFLGHGTLRSPHVYAVATGVAAGFGVSLSLRPMLTAAVLGLLVALVLFIAKPVLLIPSCFVMAFAAVPREIPREFTVAGKNVYLYQALLVAVVVWLAYRQRRLLMPAVPLVAIAVVFALNLARGLDYGYPISAISSDLEGPAVVLLGFYAAGYLVRADLDRELLQSIRITLWLSAFTTLLASTSLIEIAGRSEAAVLQATGSSALATSDSTRLISPATHFSLAVLSVVTILLLRGHPLKALSPYLLPALLIVFLSYSRNSIIGLASAVIIGILIIRSTSDVIIYSKRLIATFTAAALAVTLIALLNFLPGISWLWARVLSYQGRVLVGITNSGLENDSSAIYRENEDTFLQYSISQNPYFGHGFGHAYRPPSGNSDAFTATTGLTYAHNYYLWLVDKTGVLGLAVWVVVVVLAIAMAIVAKPTVWNIFAGSVCLGFSAISIVAPMPAGVESASALVFGLAVGVGYQSLTNDVEVRTRSFEVRAQVWT